MARPGTSSARGSCPAAYDDAERRPPRPACRGRRSAQPPRGRAPRLTRRLHRLRRLCGGARPSGASR